MVRPCIALLIVLGAAGAALPSARATEPGFILDIRGRKLAVPTVEELKKIEKAAPAAAPGKPTKPRKVLIFGKLNTHAPTPFAAPAVQILGRKTGAFESVISDDAKKLLPESIRQFDAVFANNLHEKEPLLPADFKRLSAERQKAAREVQARARKSLLSFVGAGGGFTGVHAATAACRTWPEYGKLIGAFHAGQIGGRVPIRNEQPDHPVNACFGGKDWQFSDEIYIFREPYSRANLRVLLSLDVAKLKAAGKDPAKRPDNDYAVSWVRRLGKGRVFYCSLGHMPRGYWDPTFLKHLLAGIQWAIGDLPGPGEPLPQAK